MNPNHFRSIGATTFLGPLPAVLIGCAKDDGWMCGQGTAPNLITVAWAGICCSKPPIIGISVRPERYSHGLIAGTGEFTVNLVGETLCRAMDYCGMKSGRDVNKFEVMDLTPVSAPPLKAAPALLEAPAHLCCRVTQTVSLGSHDLFLAEIVDVRIRGEFLKADGGVDQEAMKLVAFLHGQYYELGERTGFFGYSIAGKEALERRMPKRKRSADLSREIGGKPPRGSGGK